MPENNCPHARECPTGLLPASAAPHRLPIADPANTCPWASSCVTWQNTGDKPAAWPLPGDPVLADDDRPLATIRVEDDDGAHRLCMVANALGYQARREYAVDPHQTDETRDAWVQARMVYRCHLNTGEARALPFVLAGDTIAEVADALGIHTNNARAIVAAIYDKTGALGSHAQLLRLAYGCVPLQVDSEAGRKLERVRELVRDLLPLPRSDDADAGVAAEQNAVTVEIEDELRELLGLPAWVHRPIVWTDDEVLNGIPLRVEPGVCPAGSKS